MTTAAIADGAALLRTPLHDLHRELGARMVPFAGFELPVQYPPGIRHEHLHTRALAGLFDISHMGQILVSGPDAAAQLERLMPADIAGLKLFQQRYSILTHPSGGILDDLMVTRLSLEDFLLVVNGACRVGDLRHLRAALAPGCTVKLQDDQALLAVQGPEAAPVLSSLAAGVSHLRFLQAGEFDLGGVRCLVHRCGYTGEDGFELSMPAVDAEPLARRLLAHPAVQPAGLGARDTLRLEAGLCLYGHDIDATTTPVEAGLDWVIAHKYRQNLGRARFPGAERILGELSTGPARRRVGLLPQDRAPVREGTELRNARSEKIGAVTSGGFGPSVGAPIAMGYVAGRHAAPGTELAVEMRGRAHAIRVVALPFVKPRHHRA
ncbi:MAG: glycine cleavage system aminomethyltransferase GcvT [Gammaproteobacteria bacterium]|nr:glycine cleavage system aminomethyltransferase GcvT [Gammaproteobacteria bacterium]